MQYIIGDIYIGDFPITQYFGQNPSSYVKFGINGHDGLDFGVPKNTPIVSANDGTVIAVAYDAEGYGNYVKVYHPNGSYLTIYAHLTKAVVVIGQQVVRGQLLGYSGNTGNVFPVPTPADPDAGSHLHFGIAPCDNVGNKTQPNNGFAGWIDPDKLPCIWQIKKLTVPTISVGLYQHGGWYDNPATKQNQKWWVYADGTAEFLPVGLTDPTPELLIQHGGFKHGEWHDNPYTGKNQRWWCVDGKCDFLPFGLSEPPPPPPPPVETPAIPATPTPAPAIPVTVEDATLHNLNVRIQQLESDLLLANSKADTATIRANTAEVEVGRLTDAKQIEHDLRVQAENSRDICLRAQGEQNRLMTNYKNASIQAASAGRLFVASITKFMKGGEKKNGQSTGNTSGSNTNASNSNTKTAS